MKVKTWILVIFWVVLGCDTEPNKEFDDSETASDPGGDGDTDTDTDADTDSDTDTDMDSDTDSDTDTDTDSDTDSDTDTDTDGDVPTDGDSCGEEDSRYCYNDYDYDDDWQAYCEGRGGTAFQSPDCEIGGCCQWPPPCPEDDPAYECMTEGAAGFRDCTIRGGKVLYNYSCERAVHRYCCEGMDVE